MAQLSSDGYAINRVQVNAADDGDNTVIAAPAADQTILVMGYNLRAVGTGNVTIKSGAAGTVHDLFAAAASPGARLSADSSADVGVYLLDKGQALVINNAAGVDTTGFIAYRLIRTP